jgi:predicted dehydrogenase
MSRKRALRLGMVGGGEGAFIGAVHRMAARLDGEFELLAGALSSSAEKSARSAAALGLARSYGDFRDMARAKAARDDGIEVVSIVTPNHMHLPVARAFLDAGIHVICDKPLCTGLSKALAFEKFAAGAQAQFFLSHNYTAVPMIRQAREMVALGELGRLRIINAHYVQDWLAAEASEDNKQAAWRGDPARSGPGGAIADIGTHAYNLACFVSGQDAEALAADLSSFVPGRRVDDNAMILTRYASGAKGMIWASQVATGCENRLSLQIFGDKGGLEWAQEDPNYLWFTPHGGAKRLLTRAGAGAGEAANAVSRIPGGHPEGYLEAFATLYREAAQAIRQAAGGRSERAACLVPGIAAGIQGMRFIEACLNSSAQDTGWVSL